MDWLKKLFSKEVVPKVDLPSDWLMDPKPALSKPTARQGATKPTPRPRPKPAPVKRVINLSGPAAPPKVNRSRGRINTPVPAKKGTKTLDLAGKEDAFSRRSKSIIDMRNQPKG